MTPYGSGRPMPGVEIHANAFETLMQGRFVKMVGNLEVLEICAAFAVLAGLIFGYLSGWVAYSLAGALLAAAHALPYAFFARDLVLPPTAPVAAAWLAMAGAATYQHFVARRQLRRAESEKARYQQAVHFVTHEMRTPLTAIQGSSELLTRYKLTADKRDQIAGLIHSESRRLARMIETFLNVERLSAGQMELKQEPLAAAEVLRACMERVNPLAERKQIRLRSGTLQDATLMGDRELLEYAFYNLMTNAVKYSPAQTEVAVDGLREGECFRLSVRDQGIGMDKKELQNVFRKFYRTRRAVASGEAGTGIGLSHCRTDCDTARGQDRSGERHRARVRALRWFCRRWRQRLWTAGEGCNGYFWWKTIRGCEPPWQRFWSWKATRWMPWAPPARPSSVWGRWRTPSWSRTYTWMSARGWTCWPPPATGDPDCRVILMTARGTMETVMAATRGGAFDYLAKPFELDTLLEAVKRAEGSIAGTGGEDETDIDDLPESDMIGSSPQMVEIYKMVSRVAPTDATVLVEGETGTGKELIARMIHGNSPRASHPFLPVDCASIAPSLLESELFGAVRGAYTGADRDRMGIFEAANHGTVFLDEIGDIELNFQLKLLRFLQEHEVRPLGSAHPKHVDVRVVAATNRDLQVMAADNQFREDLWFRINVVRIVVPPLRERTGDVPLLAHYFIRKYNQRYRQQTRITESGLKVLQDYLWPGNVRQLQHMIERLSLLAPNGRIDEHAAQDAIRAAEPRERGSETLAGAQMDQIRKVLAATGGNKSRAARILGIERKTLYRKLEKPDSAASAE